jgi:glutathione synthase/RimK-type ligase-like ATP-grasp enzyme
VHIAVLTPAPDYPEPWDWAYDIEADALRRCGATIEPVPWTDPGDLAQYDLIVPLVAWGYHHSYGPWLRLLNRFDAEQLPVINPPDLLWWNSDKTYLAQLASKGIATVETLEVDALDEASLAMAADRFGTPDLVVKPPVSASAAGTHRIRIGESIPDVARGRRMMIQPFVTGVVTDGEYAIMMFGGEYSHTVVKRPKPGDFRVQEALGGVIVPSTPPRGAIDLARQALAAAPAKAAYARVDIVPDKGVLRIMELELIEPALYLNHAPDDGTAFARAILSAANRLVE